MCASNMNLSVSKVIRAAFGMAIVLAVVVLQGGGA